MTICDKYMHKSGHFRTSTSEPLNICPRTRHLKQKPCLSCEIQSCHMALYRRGHQGLICFLALSNMWSKWEIPCLIQSGWALNNGSNMNGCVISSPQFLWWRNIQTETQRIRQGVWCPEFGWSVVWGVVCGASIISSKHVWDANSGYQRGSNIDQPVPAVPTVCSERLGKPTHTNKKQQHCRKKSASNP